MSIVHSKVLGGANPHGSGWGILQVGIGAYRYVSPFLIKEMRHDNIETFAIRDELLKLLKHLV